MGNIFEEKLSVINIGLESFTEPFRDRGVPFVQVDFKPSLNLAPELKERLAVNSQVIEGANRVAIDRILSARPALVGMGLAGDLIPGMRKKRILHAGPPIEWDRMCGPMKGGIIGALMYEGLAASPEEAERLAGSGEIEFSPCHEHASVGPMAGIISASMPVFIVKNEAFGNVAYATQNEGL
ncbi:MAG TPA: DUF1116 domain-containing protein, partial [Bdellovibrionota bacterium]|nr:DUF1116 domain-containing protein [Bdellovibrionota bacterium]